ncbi:heat shock factor-binding protein 1 [Hydra vulgaris]|uniref:Heat shock factor-binding protein 1 n=1 Tax=Hydra vulgaris TaxID=6087 RepID=T2MI40_HYDVU|nr:heat shock factor-binding protein 1-like [Hydra vulgaris]
MEPQSPVTLNKPAPLSPSGETKNVQDLTIFVENLLGTLQEKFQTMSDGILSRMDEMGNRIDELEKNIGELMQQAGIEDNPIDK